MRDDATQIPPTAEIADLLRQADRYKAQAELMEARAQTLEEWNAVDLLRDAERRLFSAASWLWRHHDRYVDN